MKKPGVIGPSARSDAELLSVRGKCRPAVQTRPESDLENHSRLAPDASVIAGRKFSVGSKQVRFPGKIIVAKLTLFDSLLRERRSAARSIFVSINYCGETESF